ncbi:FkbM family methyltransferase [Roseibium aggregatum]|uniref:FkbM family methyltransferase n=1 Tax=Roseibium aggregatum TaxID=187304 RepID=A0A926P0A5_9HYPH|nr:FkbM family methyltransferase [Roseibium aggregatum]MBD1546598.1 FkbM family methyltransferase [Roseibium aggregatum]
MVATKTVEGWILPDSEIHFEKVLTTAKKGSTLGEYQKAPRDKALEQVTSFRRAIDIGACVGFWSRDLCDRFEHVDCFEMHEENAECLEQNLAEKKNCTIHHIGLSDRRGTDTIYINGEALGSASFFSGGVKYTKTATANYTRLDDFNFTDVDFIKMDVQFHELQALKGARKTLERNSPVLCIECCRRTSDEFIYVARIIEYLLFLGYQITGEFGKELFFSKTSEPIRKHYFSSLLERLNYVPFKS